MEHVQQLLDEVKKCTDEKKLFEFARSEIPGVAIAVARSLHSPPQVLDTLTRHHSIVVRHAVAQNPHTSIETLKRLMNDKDQLVRDYARLNYGARI